MKPVFFILVLIVSLNGFSQVKSRINRSSQNRIRPDNSGQVLNGSQQVVNGSVATPPSQGTGQTVSGLFADTSARVNGTGRSDTLANRTTTAATGAVGQSRVNNGTGNSSVAGGNDTTFNVNTISASTVTSGVGAIDRSGQAQFGQSNWGNTRSTVGESQWTVPPPITASFNKEFPASNAAAWTRNNVDTTVYSARYKSGAQWVTTNYSANGQRLNRRTEFPILQPPRAVTGYIARQPSTFRVAAIYRLQVQGKPDVFELETSTGKRVYLNNEGMEVNY